MAKRPDLKMKSAKKRPHKMQPYKSDCNVTNGKPQKTCKRCKGFGFCYVWAER